jgi:hypothetical protein
MRRGVALLAVSIAALAGSRRAHAQSAADVLAQGVRAYQDLEFDGAAGLLRRSLAFTGTEALAPTGAARALIYLAATELFRNHRDSATAVARRLVLLDPRFRPDELVFPPQVVVLYEGIRRATPAVTGRAPADTSIRPGADAFAIRLYASTFHDVSATLATEAGRVVRTLYTGPIGDSDSLNLTWNGLDSAGVRLPDGHYTVTITSLDRERRVVRILRLPLEVAQPSIDTLLHPAPPADSLLRPERQPYGPAIRALAPGALTGVTIAVLPKIVASREDASGGRFLVGGTVTIAGIAAFISHHPGRPIPGNAEHNRLLREAWRRDVNDVIGRNARRIREVRMRIRTGTPLLLTPEGP